MRTIQFRAKTISGYWIYGFLWGEKTIYNGEDTFNIKPETIGHTIGATDKNGKEIYTGDLTIDGSEVVYSTDEMRYGLTCKYGGFYQHDRKDFATLEIVNTVHDNSQEVTVDSVKNMINDEIIFLAEDLRNSKIIDNGVLIVNNLYTKGKIAVLEKILNKIS
jgi:hypothetical protein